MPKGKKYPKGCSDLGRMFDHLDKEEKARKRAEFLQSRKEEKTSAPELPSGEHPSRMHTGRAAKAADKKGEEK